MKLRVMLGKEADDGGREEVSIRIIGAMGISQPVDGVSPCHMVDNVIVYSG